MKWRIEAGNEGYKIVSYSDSSMVLATYSSNSTAGQKLILGDYVDTTSYRDEWELHEKRDYTLMYIGYEVGDPLMPPILNAVSQALETNAGMRGYGYTSLSKTDLLVHLASTSVFSCITHGLPTSISATDGYLAVSDINSFSSSAFDNLRFVYLGACYTGYDKEDFDNLVNAVYNKGADAVLGFIDEIWVEEANLWTQVFMTTLSEGATLEDAMSTADFVVRDELNNLPHFSTDSEYRHLLGSEQLIPCR